MSSGEKNRYMNFGKRGFLAAGAKDHVRCFRVEVSGSGICELSGKRIAVNIPRDQIRRINLCSGTDVKYPFFRYSLGLALFSLGVIVLALTFLSAVGRGYPVHSESGAFVLPLVPLALWFIAGIGFWLLAGVFRVRYFFLVETEKSTSKIFFGKAADVDEIKKFIRRVNMRFGYAIDISIPSPETHMK